MSKPKTSLTRRLREHSKKFGDNICTTDDDGTVLYCKICFVQNSAKKNVLFFNKLHVINDGYILKSFLVAFSWLKSEFFIYW